MSSTVPSRFSGIEAAMVLWYSGPSDSSPSVMMLPGMTALTVIPYFASSIAAVRRKHELAGFRRSVMRPAGKAGDRTCDRGGDDDPAGRGFLEVGHAGFPRRGTCPSN